jgi:isopentenyl diphosphate isomerase/L-lactate dehydrogenase-like FMN-dependent dehydrogenase
MTWTTPYQPLSLEIVASTDSDGDSRWTLEVRGEGHLRRLISSINDPNLPRSVGEWLSGATGVPLGEKGEPSLFERAG